jgi:CheY-like chemotaxis protein
MCFPSSAIVPRQLFDKVKARREHNLSWSSEALEKAGANVTATTTVRHALILIDHDVLAGAVMDHALGDGDSTELCARLKARGIPYVSYSACDPLKGASLDPPHVSKPVTMDMLLSTLEALLPRLPRIS